MYIKKDFDFEDLTKECWSGAVDTLQTIEENKKENELMKLLEDVFIATIPTIAEINDLLWFDDDEIFQNLGIRKE